MSCDLPYMRLWVSDLQADLLNMGLTDEEFGVYMRLLLVAWKEGSIPLDMKQRARKVAASPARLQKLWPALESKWISDGNGGLVNPRQEREREEATEAHARRVAAGKKGGRPKGSLSK